MLAGIVFHCGVLMLYWAGRCGAPQLPTRQQLNPTPSITEPASPSLVLSPCFVDDIFSLLREDVLDGAELSNSSLALFGCCTASDNSSGSVLLELAEDMRRNQKDNLEVLFPASVLVSEDVERGTFVLTFDLPQSPLLTLKPVLLLVSKDPLAVKDLDVTFSSPSLQPETQSVCISGDTQYILITAKSPESTNDQKWRISVETKSRDTQSHLRDILIGGKSGSNIGVTPLLLFPGGTETGGRQGSGPPPSSLQTSFLCELRRFLGDVVPQQPPETPQVQLESLHSLPPLMLGPSSSETLLAGLMNSSATTVFSFTGWSSSLPLRHGELDLAPPLLDQLRLRLQEVVTQILETIREEKVDSRATRRLERLREFSLWQEKEVATGERQYCAFLLFKALQTVAQAYYMQRKLRATRAHPVSPVAENVCGLRTLTVSLERVLVGPNSANIYNCQGSCAFPLTNANNHAVQLHYHIESGHQGVRAPCCVPTAYEGLEVMELNQQGTYISTKPDVIAKECGCR